MNNLPRGDFNMPPSVRATDIPGNSPSDKEPPECSLCDTPLESDEEISMGLCQFHINEEETDYHKDSGKN